MSRSHTLAVLHCGRCHKLAFPWLVSGENSRAFCQAAAEQGILLAPGDCFDAPSHFRLGFAALTDNFPEALRRLGELVEQQQRRLQRS